MAIRFNKKGIAYFNAKKLGTVRLRKKTWDEKCKHPERRYLKYNDYFIKITLKTPNLIRRSTQINDCYLFYKDFLGCQYYLGPNITATLPRYFRYFVVVVRSSRKQINTIYFTGKIKRGETIWPKSKN